MNSVIFFISGEDLVPKPSLQDQEEAAPDARVQHADPKREARGGQGVGQGRHAHFPSTKDPHLPKEWVLFRTQQERLLRLRPNQQGDSTEVSQDHPGVHADSMSAIFEFYALVPLF